MAKRSKQLEFSDKALTKPKDVFGGSLLKGNPKGKRPLDSKFPVHLVLRAQKSGMRLPKTFGGVNELVYKTTKKHGVRIYSYANVGNHLHILLRVPRVARWAAFIRELTGQIAQLVRKYLSLTESYWLYRPFTRIIRGWKKAFKTVKLYLYLNQQEAEGKISRTELKTLKNLTQTHRFF